MSGATFDLSRRDVAALMADLAKTNALVNFTARVVVTIHQVAPAVPASWEGNARAIAERLHREGPQLPQDKLARAVRHEMVNQAGAPGMTTRSGRTPSVGSTKRHALRGLSIGQPGQLVASMQLPAKPAPTPLPDDSRQLDRWLAGIHCPDKLTEPKEHTCN